MGKILLLLALLISAHARAAPSLEIIFEERIPYVSEQGESISGIVATPLINALQAAKITYSLQSKPSNRHLHEIQANLTPLCAVGWFKNPQREAFAKFTRPLYHDKPMGVLVRRDDTAIHQIKDLDTLLQQQGMKLLSKASYSYGSVLDAKLAQYQVKRHDVSVDNVTSLTLIAKKRGDYLFISQEEAALLLVEHPEREQLEVLEIAGMPEGSSRYLICSQMVDDEVIAALNAQIP
ncbi:MAG: transporter substrate-binding domain-containing protein [Gammaproteobacteria bacterium]|nr:transporter substrate-binding domain-containing protein [Gammaproteobacteria bacterium]